jgi:predicted metal-dependent peptidase
LLAKFQGELNSILGDVKPEAVNIVYCDTKVTAVQEFTPDDFPVELEAKGGGGTYFQPVFDWVEQEDLDPACLIYLTDMWNSDSIEEPPYPVLWADYGSGAQTQDFGEIIIIE